MDQRIILDAWRGLLPQSTPCAVCVREASNPVDPELLSRLTPEEISYYHRLPENSSRRIEWAEGRRCLIEVQKRLPIPGRVLTSLSHSKSRSGHWVIAVGCVAPEGITGVGVDLENKSRVIGESVLARIASVDEIRKLSEPLALWTAKESCFKAHPSNTERTLSEFVVRAYDVMEKKGIVDGPLSVSCKFQWVETEDWSISLAFSFAEKLD